MNILKAGVASMSLLVCTALAQQPAACFRGDARHSAVYDTKPAGVSTLKWKFKTGARVVSSPAIADDTVFIGSGDHNLYALKAGSGELKWKFGTGSAVNSSPAVWNGSVFASSVDGNIYAVDAESGKVKWKFQTEGERRFTAPGIHGQVPRHEMMPDTWDFYLSSPVIVEGVLYIGSGDGNVYALDAASGTLKWKFKTGDVVHSTPAVADGVVYAGSWDTYLYALDAQSGKEMWKFKTGEDPQYHNQIGIQSSPVVTNGVVYFGCRDSNVYALDAKTGAEKWKFNNKGSWVIVSPVVHDGRVYFATSDSSKMYALDAATGKAIYDLDTGYYVFGSPSIAGDFLYLATWAGKVHRVDLKKQQYDGFFQTDGSREHLAGYSDAKGHLDPYKVFTDMTMEASILGINKLMLVGTILSSPVPHDGVLYFGSADGYVYAVM